MFSFLVSPLPRSKTAHLNPLVAGGGTTGSSLQILAPVKSPAAAYAMRQFVSANPKNIPENSPYHWHTTHTEVSTAEVSTVEQGVIKAMVGGDILAGQTTVIQPGQYHAHSFAGVSTVDPSQVATLSDVTSVEDKADEAFFRNLYSYLDDCEKHKKRLSPFQMLMFMTAADTRLTLPAIQRGISKIISFFDGAVVSEWLLGLGRGYPEYADGVELDDMQEMREK